MRDELKRNEFELLHDRYSRALFMQAEEDGTIDEVMQELTSLNIEWLGDEEFKRFLMHPLVDRDEKKSVIEKLLHNNKCCNTIIGFLKILIDNKRENLIHGVFLRYKDLYDEYKSKTILYVEAPRKLTMKEEQDLSNALRRKFRTRINLEFRKNPELIGGIFIQHKDRVYDCSIKGQLRNLEEHLTK